MHTMYVYMYECCLSSVNVLPNIQHTYILAQQAFSAVHRLFFNVEMRESTSFDVATGPAQTTPSSHALNF